MIDLFGNDTAYEPSDNRKVNRNRDGSWKFNPMTLTNGVTEGERCKNCIHFIRKKYSGTYFKCALRNNVSKKSTQSDHRANWEACGKFQGEKL